MEAFNFKAEKQSTMSIYNIFTGITKTLRLLELCLALIFLLWILTRLPFFLSISVVFLRSPLFVFALSNAIIAALLAQSNLLSSSSSSADSAAPMEEQIKYTCTNDVDSCTISQSLPESMNGEGEINIEDQMERPKLLRRSETEMVTEIMYPEDKLSNEEFQRTIEAFIAKQMRFLREESC